MIGAQLTRLNKIHSQSFYLIAVELYKEQYLFQVSGSTANLYTVTINSKTNVIDKLINCNCPDALNGAWEAMVKCKHCCFILVKVLKQPETFFSLYQLSPTKKDQMIQAISYLIETHTYFNQLSHPDYQEKYLKLSSQTKTDLFTQEEECPICFESLTGEHGITCIHCHNKIHKACIDKWVKSGNTTCIFCRGKWKCPSTSKGYFNLNQYKKNYFGSDSE